MSRSAVNDGAGPYGATVKSRPSALWPAGKHLAQHSDLAALLSESAQEAAQRALRLFVSDDRLELLQAALAAGTAVEHLAKAVIVSVEPTLLADKVDRDTLLWLSGKGNRAETRATRIRTVGALNAVKLVAALHKGASVPSILAEAALEARNAAAHVGLVDRDELHGAVGGMCSTVDVFLNLMGSDRGPFWGDYLGVADTLIEADRAAVEQIVAAKFASAHARLARLTDALPADYTALVLATMAQKPLIADHEEERPCPACGQRAWLACDVEEGDVEFDHDEDSVSAWVSRTAYPLWFECSVCGLTLDERELQHLGLGVPIELDDRDLDPAEYYEPDEDMYRDR